MNYKTLSEKADIYINNEIAKLEYNIVKSAKQSETVEDIYTKIVFSNNDEYTYNSALKKIYKNGGTLISDVESFNVIKPSAMAALPIIFEANLDKNVDYIILEVVLKKYGVEQKYQILVTTGVDQNG